MKWGYLLVLAPLTALGQRRGGNVANLKAVPTVDIGPLLFQAEATAEFISRYEPYDKARILNDFESSVHPRSSGKSERCAMYTDVYVPPFDWCAVRSVS